MINATKAPNNTKSLVKFSVLEFWWQRRKSNNATKSPMQQITQKV